MDFLKQVGAVLDQYESARPEQPPAAVERDFETFSRVAPQTTLADGLAAAFRSDRTPPFPHMLGQLFDRTPRTERAGILNHLLRTLGPALLARKGVAIPAGRRASDVPAELAEQVSPQQVQDLADEAEKKDPTIVDRISDVYARHPDLVRTLGTAALTIALSQAAKRQRVAR